MRILHVVHSFPPFSRAGSENYVEALAREQLRRHQVVVFHRVSHPERPEYHVDETEFSGIPVLRLNRTFRDLASFEGTYRNDFVASAFGETLDRLQPHVVHFHHTTCLSTTCVHEVKRRGLPVVYTLHDFWLLCPRGQLLRRNLAVCARNRDADCVRCMAPQLSIRGGAERLGALDRRAERAARLHLPSSLSERLAVRPFAREREAISEIKARTRHVREMCGHVDRFVAPSRFLADRYERFGLPRERMLVSDYGFETKRWRGAEPHSPCDRLRVAYLGTWIPSKGVHVLVEAFRELDPRRFLLDIHGYAVPYDGFEDYEGHLKRLAGASPHIRFPGAYDPEDVPALLAQADVLVVPSIWYENSPLTIHEGFLARVPVVAADHGGMRELLSEGGGVTFEPDSAASLRAVLQGLAADPERLQALRDNIPSVKEIGENALEMEALYRACEEVAGARS